MTSPAPKSERRVMVSPGGILHFEDQTEHYFSLCGTVGCTLAPEPEAQAFLDAQKGGGE